MRRLTLAALIAGGVFAVPGCTSSSSDGFAYGGQYHNTYSRGGGTIVFGVSSGTSISVVINDSSGILVGQGTREGASFSFSAAGTPGSVTVQGAFSGSGSSRSLSGSVSGALTFNYATVYAHAPDLAVFDPHTFTATLAGDSLGALLLNVNATGQISGTLTITGQPPGAVTGTVSSVGTANFSATVDGQTFTFFGVFRVMSPTNIVLEGTWSRSPTAGSGTWQGGIQS